MKVSQILSTIDEFAPFSTQLGFDNSGLLIGDPQGEVTSALLALDLTDEVLDEALETEAQLVITHHPVIFSPLKSILKDSIVYRAVQSGISVICAHTNLDMSPVGVNEYLARILCLEDISGLEGEDDLYSMGRLGTLPEELSPEDFAHRVGHLLSTSGLRYVCGNRPILRVAVCGGSGGSMLGTVLGTEADAFVTGDVKHDVFIAAKRAGLTLIDAGHFETETVVLPPLCALLEKEIPTVSFATAKSGACPVRSVE